MTETERQLFLWFPMWAVRLLLLCYTKIPSPQEDLSRHVGCRPRYLSLYLGLRMGFNWPHKKSNLLDAHKNEAQDKRNCGKKNAAKEYLKPEASIRAK
jgi:hypothetical protein